jgi:hypothetical protein
MKKIIFGICLIIMAFSSCEQADSLPNNILSDSVMTDILVEISIVDAAYNYSLSKPDAVRFKQEFFYEKIMKNHNTNRNQFIESLNYYSINTKRLQKIYEDALVELSKRQVKQVP